MDLFSMVDPIGWTHSIVLQAATIEVKPSAEVELLKSQLEFLKADHARLAADFAERMKQLTTQSASVGDDFKTYLNYVSGLILFATGIFGFIGWNSLEQAKSSIKTMVDRQLSGTVAETVDREIQMVRRSILREQVVSNTTIDYFLKDGVEPAEELRLLRSRGFSKIRFCREVGKLRCDTADVVVVDLEHWLPEAIEKNTGLHRPPVDTPRPLPPAARLHARSWLRGECRLGSPLAGRWAAQSD